MSGGVQGRYRVWEAETEERYAEEYEGTFVGDAILRWCEADEDHNPFEESARLYAREIFDDGRTGPRVVHDVLVHCVPGHGRTYLVAER
jgi:protein-tyrosine phosphatase